MKTLLLSILLLHISAPAEWLNDLDVARQKAKEQHRHILLNFSGSDWCGPCIRLRKDIFDSDEFTAFAADNLVLVNADFPRLKKNALPVSQQKKNDQLADAYNKTGVFPLTLLLRADGTILHAWEGIPGKTPSQLVEGLKSIIGKQ